MFSPEFRNRLDAVIGFSNLEPETVYRVVDKFVMQLEAQLADRAVTIELTDEARIWLGDKGYDRLYGARPLARVIQEHVKKALADELLFGRLTGGGHVKVQIEAGKVAFDVIPAPKRAKPGKGDGDGDGERKVTEPVT